MTANAPDSASNRPAGQALRLLGIEKRFFGNPVLKRVSFELPAGHTLGLVGENGAGKSTLMNLIGGNLAPDAGSMLLEGRPYAPRTPQDAARAGIAFIHQELNLFPNLSIAENLFIHNFPRRRGLPFIDRTAIRARSRALLERVGLPAGPETLVERLSAGERQLVEIASAIGMDARLVILDEPTTSLTSKETVHLFNLLRQLQTRGVALIYISHNLGDVLGLAHEIVVLRDGEVAGHGPREHFDRDRLVSLMVGRTLTQLFPVRATKPESAPVLEVRGLTQPGFVRDINFTLHQGEVLGVSGLMGSGRSELARLLFGLDPMSRGDIRVGGRPQPHLAPRRSIQQGMVFLTENRREEGLLMDASIADNIALVTLPSRARRPLGFLDLPAVRTAVSRIRGAVKLTASARDDQPVKTLSGGNQQKVVLAKWLLAEPAVLILDEPTRGIDVGAKQEIYQLIADLAARGAGVLVISSEIEELMGLCDRILVMRQGEISDELRREDFSPERLLRAALHERVADSPERVGAIREGNPSA